MKTYTKILYLALLIIPTLAFIEGDKTGDKSERLQKATELIYLMKINNLQMTMNNEGILADVRVGSTRGGIFDNHVFLYSAGFLMSGITNGTVWTNGVATASRIHDYQQGTIQNGRTDPRNQLYILKSSDPPFSESWFNWKDAVALGAKYYDGDKDGKYLPVDKNRNGLWDLDEDKPDLLGDETVWCVYNDGVDPILRRFDDVSPQGIEIRQTVFGFAAKGFLSNMLFVRYEILNTGSVAEQMDSVFFSVWSDPDIGAPYDDLVGSDTLLDAGFTYNEGSDAEYGANPPCYLVDFLQGPASFIPGETFIDANGNGNFDEGETPLTTAKSVEGQTLGIKEIPGAKNLGLSSFVHYFFFGTLIRDPADKTEMRNYMKGQDRFGSFIDPCTWFAGFVNNVDCAQVDPLFWYSGDPVSRVGWLNAFGYDQRQMLNTGPFKLKRGEPVTIVAAYVVGRGTSARSSVNQAKTIDRIVQKIYDKNFEEPGGPPSPVVEVETSDDFIDLSWRTRDQVTYNDIDYGNYFEGYRVYAFKTNSIADKVANQPNKFLYRYYDKKNFIENIYFQDAATHGFFNTYPVSDSTKLDSLVYADPDRGIIRMRITRDPFTNGPLVKGKEYYFAVTSYALNYDNLEVYPQSDPPLPFGTFSDYVFPETKPTGVYENLPVIVKVTMGEDSYNPPVWIQNGNHIQGAASGVVGFDVINKYQLKSKEYQVNFFRDSSETLWSTFYKLTNVETGDLLLDSSKNYNYTETSIADQPMFDGFIPRVQDISPAIDSVWPYESINAPWFRPYLYPTTLAYGNGVYYVGKDLSQGKTPPDFTLVPHDNRSNSITADRLRRVELRFGTPGKAYRYLNNFITLPTQNSYIYAEAVTAADTVGKNWNLGKLGEGFVDVPFTAWVVDERYNEEYQLAVGFIEKRKLASTAPKGNPDGNWDPGDSIRASGEFIMIFDSPYDPEGNQIEYTGGQFNIEGGGAITKYADVMKFLNNTKLPQNVVGVSDEQRKTFNSPWFDAMYVVGMSRKDMNSFYSDGDALILGVAVYPYTEKDVYNFNTIEGSTLTAQQRAELFKKVNVFPNPLFAYNPATSYNNGKPDEPFVTFSNLPAEFTIKIFSLSGMQLITLSSENNVSPDSPFLRWDLRNDEGLRVASGLYIAIVNAPGYGEKILKFSLIMPERQIRRE